MIMQKKYSREIPNKVERMGGKFVLNYHLQETTEEEILSLWESEHYGMEEDYGLPDDYYKEERKQAETYESHGTAHLLHQVNVIKEIHFHFLSLLNIYTW